MLVPFIKHVAEFNHGAWAISAAALNLGPIKLQLEFKMFDTSNNTFSTVCLSDEKSRISRMSLSEYPNKRISP